MQLVDSHAHLDHIDNLGGALARAQDAGVTKIITVGTSVESCKRCIEITDSTSLKLRGARENIPEIYATVGIHPKDGKEEVEKFGLKKCLEALGQIAKSSNKVVAIGECGLDYYLDSDKQKAISDKGKEFQGELFEAQIKLAAELDLPLVIHCRNGWEEIFDLISNVQFPFRLETRSKRAISNFKLRGVFHCWTGDWSAAKKALDLGFYISFSGIVTFKNASDIQEVAKKAPIDRILVETDSPFLAPKPHRGKINTPENVKIVAQFIADLRGNSFAEICAKTSSNAQILFKLL